MAVNQTMAVNQNTPCNQLVNPSRVTNTLVISSDYIGMSFLSC